MSTFKAKMHQILFPLGLCPRQFWGAHSAPQTLWLYLSGLLLCGGKRMWRRNGEREEEEPAAPATARASDSTCSTAARVISFRHSFIHSFPKNPSPISASNWPPLLNSFRRHCLLSQYSSIVNMSIGHYASTH